MGRLWWPKRRSWRPRHYLGSFPQAWSILSGWGMSFLPWTLNERVPTAQETWHNPYRKVQDRVEVWEGCPIGPSLEGHGRRGGTHSVPPHGSEWIEPWRNVTFSLSIHLGAIISSSLELSHVRILPLKGNKAQRGIRKAKHSKGSTLGGAFIYCKRGQGLALEKYAVASDNSESLWSCVFLPSLPPSSLFPLSLPPSFLPSFFPSFFSLPLFEMGLCLAQASRKLLGSSIALASVS
jgi:hypothetical protein